MFNSNQTSLCRMRFKNKGSNLVKVTFTSKNKNCDTPPESSHLGLINIYFYMCNFIRNGSTEKQGGGSFIFAVTRYLITATRNYLGRWNLQ